jgi:hypothetical protein
LEKDLTLLFVVEVVRLTYQIMEPEEIKQRGGWRFR